MSSWLELRRLRYFVAIHQHGSLSEASRRLNIAQPALTHHLREIEKDLGTAVFVRRRYGVELTEAGQLLLQQARKVLDTAEEAQAEMDQYLSRQQAEGKIIRLSFIPTLTGLLTTRILAAAAVALPGCRIHIQELYARESHMMIEKGELDFSVTLASPNKEHDVLAYEELYYVHSSAAAEETAEPITIQEVAAQPLFLPSRAYRLREYLDAICARRMVELRVVLEIDGLMPRKESVAAGLGSTILPMAAITHEVAAGILVARPISPPLMRPIIFEQRKGMEPRVASRMRSIVADILSDTGYLAADAPMAPV